MKFNLIEKILLGKNKSKLMSNEQKHEFISIRFAFISRLIFMIIFIIFIISIIGFSIALLYYFIYVLSTSENRLKLIKIVSIVSSVIFVVSIGFFYLQSFLFVLTSKKINFEITKTERNKILSLPFFIMKVTYPYTKKFPQNIKKNK
ncbi:unknown; predicted coding region [Mycoplasmopsis pulmonis]|uniref:Uncharacterized protein n=1 Tax=Mycoplasmopsis pulmonis (strain UAB CTIP) TaxID=272635 RepID=Q98R60_MYCPU|nr:hypothetical protein [Mycoplasmopsis pulmonis]MDZ7293119.1 hypothetical protein [Mycoplasmopsis pulmonis]CAC13323.1 unknown; predicted coding region [Mycoplasmopsis pulmonis]VEU67916.1 Uncharacterised protein [Mycoplasmopsis pulmonis]